MQSSISRAFFASIAMVFCLGAGDSADHAVVELYKSGCVELAGIDFTAGKSGLKEKSPPLLRSIAQALIDDVDLRLKIIVHAEADKNLELARTRAGTIRTWLMREAKVPATRLVLSSIALGEKPPEGCRTARGYLVNLN